MWNFKVSRIQALAQNLKVTCTLKFKSSQFGKNKILMIFLRATHQMVFRIFGRFLTNPQVLYDCCLFCQNNLITGYKIRANRSSRLEIRKIVYHVIKQFE